MPTATVNGVELHYEDRGAGPPIVFQHGRILLRTPSISLAVTTAARTRVIVNIVVTPSYRTRHNGSLMQPPATQ